MFTKSKKGYYFWDEFSKMDGLVHGFSTRHFGSIKNRDRINEKNLKKFLNVLGVGRRGVVFPKQVHGSNILVVNDVQKGEIVNADGLITQRKNIFLGVVTADCLPVIFYDPKSGAIGIAHAGYKGILKGILKEMVKKFKKLRSYAEDILVAIGPSIGVCCYDVSLERVKMFEDKFKRIKTYEKRDGKYFLDLKNIAKQTLISEGLSEKNIEVSDICTKDNVKDFFSFRREGREKFGEFVTVVGMI